ncbi:MAG: META domain-containing protein [Bacteroides sp.]|nr:META domain-containing protein [Bacteroides sp.]
MMIKKILVPLCVACAIFALSSCRSAKEVTYLPTINGEWSIVEINGAAVVPAAGQEYPSIGFETTTGKVYGNSSCNRFHGTFDTNADPGKLDLSALVSTRMMCLDMTLENNVMNALKNVSGYKKLGNRIALTNNLNRPVILLDVKIAVSKTAVLEGEWKITEVNGELVPTNLEKKPFLNFDVQKNRIHGNAGCNMINGGFVTKEDDPMAISFPAVAATMMACPDMTLERKVLDALNVIKTFEIINDKSVAFYDEGGVTKMRIEK